jgi:hypothetical protein
MGPRPGQSVVNGFFTLRVIHTTSQISSIGGAQRLKPCTPPDVLSHVNTINPRNEAMVQASSRRFVKVAPPTVHAGVGNALRQAYAMDGEARSLKMFEDLLSRLDQE